MTASTLLDYPEAVPVCESALAWADNNGLRLDLMSLDDLYSRLRAELIDRDCTAEEYLAGDEPPF